MSITTTGETNMSITTTLAEICKRINTITQMPQHTHSYTQDGKCVHHVGNYHISKAYGWYSLHRVVSESGGTEDVFRCGHVTAKDLTNRMFAFIEGLNWRQ